MKHVFPWVRPAVFVSGALLWLGVMALSSGCASHSTTSRTGTRNLDHKPDSESPTHENKPALTGEASSGLKVVLTLEGRPKGKTWQTLKDGGSLHSGDALRTQVRLSTGAFLYVVQFFADGSASVLFPPAPEKQRFNPPGVPILLPDSGWIFELDQNAGEEHVYVIASLKPLEEVDHTLVQVLEDVRESGGAPPEPPGKTSETSPVNASGSASGGAESTVSGSNAPTLPTEPPPASAPAAEESAPAGSVGAEPGAGKAGDAKAGEGKTPGAKPASPAGSRPVWSARNGSSPLAKGKDATLVAQAGRVRRSQESLTMNTRGVELKTDPEVEKASLVYAADKDGIAVLHFQLRHLP